MEKPTCWKSTLLNPLLNEKKAIVSDIAGTTCDFIEDEIHIEGVNFRFIDTAGIREARDKIEKIGVERTKQKMKDVSLILYLFDLKEESLEEIQADIQVWMSFKIKRYPWPILFFLVIGSISCNNDKEILEPFDVNLLYGKWQQSGRNGIASPNDNFYEFRNTFTFEQCLEGDCHFDFLF